MLQHPVVQLLLGNDLFELAILVFKLFEPLGLTGLHATVLVLPAMKGRFADTRRLQDRRRLLARNLHRLRVPKLLHYLLLAMSFTFLRH